MKTKHVFTTAVALSVFLSARATPLSGAQEPARRITRDLQSSETFVLPHSVSPRIQNANDLGAVPDSFTVARMVLHFQMSAAQRKDLEGLLQRQLNRQSRDYHKWLTPEEFGSRYGMDDTDLQKVQQWLEMSGFTGLSTSRSKTSISFAGTAGQVRQAFGTEVHRYLVNGAEHYANQSELSLPAALNGVAAAVRGLSSFHPKPRSVKPAPRFTSSISGNHFLAPDDVATIYDLKPLYNGGINGTGQSIAVAGQTDVDLADIRAFRQSAGLPANDPQIVIDGTDPGTSKDDLGEADLDLEWTGGMAPNATIVYVASSDAFESATYAVENNLAPILSLSYGVCEAQISSADANSLATTFQQANAQGITIVAATGDNGAADCDGPPVNSTTAPATATQGPAVDVPSSTPYVTGVGGTTLQEAAGGTYWSTSNNGNNGSAQSYIPEVAWNDTTTVGELSASGGGKSLLFTKPSWQVAVGVPADGQRDTPDLAFAASPNHDGYLVCSGGTCVNGFRATDTTLNVVGGASVTAPVFAAIVALLNQQTKTRQGNVNPRLYQLATFSSNAFHDITSGSNIVTCKAGSPGCPGTGSFGFSAGPGYDQVTGLGSVDAYSLVAEWGADFTVAANPNTLTVNVGKSGTTAVTVSPVSNFQGSVSFTCSVSSALANTTCSIPGTVNSSGSVNLTVTSSGAATTMPQFRLPHGSWPMAIAIGVLALGAMMVRFPSRRLPQMLAGCAALVLLTGFSACGGGSSASQVIAPPAPTPPSVTGNVTVTAASGVLSHTVLVSVTVP